MRTHTQENVTINYPDEHCYIFNPVNIEVGGLNSGTRAVIKVEDIEVVATAFKGVAVFNISEILQSLFNTKELSIIDLGKEVSPSKTAKIVSVAVPEFNLSFSTLAVWGALQTDLGITIGGDYNNDFNGDFYNAILKGHDQTVVWHYGLPFSVSVPMMQGDKLRLSVDGVDYGEIFTAANSMIANVFPNEILNNRGLGIASKLVLSLANDSVVKRKHEIEINRQNCNLLHLRWIDKKGYYCYWAFDKATDSYESEKYGVYVPTFTRQIDYIDGFNGGDGRQQGKTAKRSIGLVAPLVAQSTWNYLLAIAQSPIVDLFTDNDYLGEPRFIKVDVAAGKMENPAKELSDFNISIILPEINNQKL